MKFNTCLLRSIADDYVERLVKSNEQFAALPWQPEQVSCCASIPEIEHSEEIGSLCSLEVRIKLFIIEFLRILKEA